MEEGKLPLDLLEEMIPNNPTEIKGIIQGPRIGRDVAVIDYKEAIKKSQKFYNSKAPAYLVYKTDPITFPTPNPGHYAVIVNANDVVTSGALPYGFNSTIILPPTVTKEEVFSIQKGITNICQEMNIAILGGHTEFSSAVNTPIISGAMIGFVPKDYFVTRTISEGDSLVCVGWCAKEGIGIIANEGKELLESQLSKMQLDKLISLGSDISIVDIALTINKEIHPSLMHDATEGGVLGAAYETIVSEGFGLDLISDKFPLTPETKLVCELLKINPLRLISSGTLLLVTTDERAQKIAKTSTEEIPIEIIGKVTSKENGIKLDGKSVEPPGPDAIIKALEKIGEGKI